MKFLDKVKVQNNNYFNEGVKKGDIGTIIFSWITDIDCCFEVVFSDSRGKDYATVLVHVGDLELVKDNGVTDEEILADLPLNNPKCWCKVENGYILNLLGEKKNSIPYDYNS